MSKQTVKVELTHEEWVEAQELALSIESLVDGQQDELAEQLNPVRDFLVALANKVSPVPKEWRDADRE